MKTCDNCGGVLDEKGKCIACGKVSEMKLSGDGESSSVLPKYISRLLSEEDELDKRIKRNCDGDCGDCDYTECIHSIR